MTLEGRVAIVTGSAGGLGRSHVRYLARKGARVVVNDLSQDAVDSVAREIIDAGGEAMAIAGSVTDDAAREIWPEGWESPKPYIRIVKQPTG